MPRANFILSIVIFALIFLVFYEIYLLFLVIPPVKVSVPHHNAIVKEIPADYSGMNPDAKM